MGVILEIKAGAMAGKRIAIATGQTVTFGRAAGRAQFALPHDTFMSGVHFAVECGPQGCRVQDRKSSNGTFLNGARIQDAMLANGDEIKSGQTIFAVRIVADAKLASLLPSQEVAPPHTPAPRPRAAEPEQPSAPELPPPARAPVDVPEPPSPVMRTADLDEAADSPPERDAAVEQPARKSSDAGLPSQSFPPMPDVPAKSAPPVEGLPRFHAIPGPAGVGPKPPGPSDNLPNASAKPRSSEPPPGVAPYMAEKYANLPASRGGVSPRGAAFSVMGWSFPAAPAEWQVQEGFGLQQSGHEEFPSSVAATEELLGGITLQQFVESQISMLRGYLRDPKIEPTMPPRVGGADESMAMDVRHSTKDGRELVYRRIYARSGSSVGVLTVTTLAAELPQVLQSLQPLLEGAAFRATVNN
jgi:hypothetical protein